MGHQEESFHVRRDEQIQTHALTWMNLEHIRLNEISQTQEDNYCMIPLT